ncbi:MAG: Ig-like domain-containing protein [Clostridiales Family XIII bacterium]|jgi:hypothetical protein|nr:Ig-like domain-containing protein [Clostridiales Family XIII bacterium]
MDKKTATMNQGFRDSTNRIALLLFALLLSLALVISSVSPVYGASKDKSSKVKLSKTKASLTVGETLTLKVKGTKAKISWSSSNKKIATVTSKGKVKAVKAGKATVKATYKVNKKKKTLKCVVTIKAKPKAITPAPTPTTPAPTPATEQTPVQTPTPDPPLFQTPARVSFSKAIVTLPANDMDYAVNYVTASIPEGAGGYTFTVNGSPVAATPVFSDGDLLKIAIPAGVTQATVAAESNGASAGSAAFSFRSAGQSEPSALYGTIPMKFSEYFHDVTAEGSLSTATAFAKSGAVASPKLFITQGTRSGNVIGGVDTLTYAEAEAAGLPYVDAVSTATYGDSVHFAPDGNLTLIGDRETNTDPNKAITGIAAAEVGVAFDLYANASILKSVGKSTAQSRNVLSKLSKLSGKFVLLNVVKADGSVLNETGRAVSAPAVYKPKAMLTDGNWGSRTLVNRSAVRDLPGDGNSGDPEVVAYGGNWGDKITGFSFGDATALGTEFAGASYWDNFANNIYGGIITDSEGHSEPLVFLQNLFSHRMHEDFDVAISPSRFSRLGDLKSPDTYTVTVFAEGFEDITFEYGVKNYSNASIAVDGATSVTPTSPPTATVVNIKGLDNASAYVAGAKLTKGGTDVSGSLYSIEAVGRNKARLTLSAGFFTGSYQGSYSLAYETAVNVSKPLSFTVVNSVSVKLSLTSGGTPTANGYAEATPLSVAKAGSPLIHFVGADGTADFAKSLLTTGRSGYSIIENLTTASASEIIGDAVTRAVSTDSTLPYRIDISSAKFVAGNTYKLTLRATGFLDQVYYISVT